MVHNRITQPEEDLVRVYLNDIGKYRLLSKEDEVCLAQAAEAGRCARDELLGDRTVTALRKRELCRMVRDGDEAVDTFVKANLRLVVSIAKKYQAGPLPLLDLVQEGNLGLMHAVNKFDWRKGFSSRRMPLGGSVRPSLAASRMAAALCDSRAMPTTFSHG